MELNLKIEGDSPQEIIAKLTQYVSQVAGEQAVEGLEAAAASIPGVTANAGGGGGP